ncbi:MAG: class I SAM-dependent rRNA methyltransferase [Pirellulales bacterium]|nr:class I SAM-dependent rRNA methyltransferase [Pirellulales bacterium]
MSQQNPRDANFDHESPYSAAPTSATAAMAGGLPTVRLKPRKSRPFYGRHPWVLDSAVESITGLPGDGDAVQLLNEKGKFIATGYYNSQSRIRVRLYSWNPTEALDEAWLAGKIVAAIELRRQLGLLEPSSAARMIFSESDGLSGLIVDRLGDYLAIQVNALAMARRLPQIIPILQRELRPHGIVIKQERGIGPLEGVHLPPETHWGELPAAPLTITEHHIKYAVDLRTGQKTGFYIDQRDNRRAAAKYASGRRVLDMFCYSGGFGLNCLVHGDAQSVLAVDSSAAALHLAGENARLNHTSDWHSQQADAFDHLAGLATGPERFGLVVLDPPKFANKRSAVDEALMAYHRLNRLAVELLEPQGILVTCCCSGHVLREDFLHMLGGVAQRSGRDLQILEQRGAAADHPVSATCLETEYLKCVICRVG